MTTNHGWQPIETAPRDGTEVLLYHKFKQGKRTHHFRKVGMWSTKCKRWFMDDVEYPKPTLWHPLPPPPRLLDGRSRSVERDTPPEVGSLWLHNKETRMTARKVELVNDMPSHECVGYKMPNHPEMRERLQLTWCSLPDWLAWAANARRIDNA